MKVLETKKAKLVSVAAAGKISKEIHQLRYHKKITTLSLSTFTGV